MSTVNVVRKQSNRVRPGMRLHFDYWLVLTVAGLLIFGMMMVYSTTFDYGLLFKNEPTFYFKRQVVALLLGLLCIVVIMQFDYHVFRKLSVPFLGLTLISLAIVLFFGETIFGAQRGLYEGSYQPSEVAKLAVVLYISHWLSSKGDRIKDVTYGLIPFSIITGVVCAFVLQQPALSTATLIAFICFTLFFVAGADWRQFAAVAAVGGLAFFILANTLPHAVARVESYKETLRDPAQASWHVQQALIALGRGGMFGVGIGESTQKFGPLPAAHTDGVFAIMGEELGFLGAMVFMGLMVFLVWRGIKIALNARDSYGYLLALGVVFWFSYQALINVAVITAVIPFTGIPLPFMSYGGSSLLTTMIGVGILLNVSRDAAIERRNQPDRKK